VSLLTPQAEPETPTAAETDALASDFAGKIDQQQKHGNKISSFHKV
jgi:hypothetical protein